MQIKEEVKGCLDFLEYTYNVFGFTYDLELSTVSSRLIMMKTLELLVRTHLLSLLQSEKHTFELVLES